jgi:hypothetical protein
MIATAIWVVWWSGGNQNNLIGVGEAGSDFHAQYHEPENFLLITNRTLAIGYGFHLQYYQATCDTKRQTQPMIEMVAYI